MNPSDATWLLHCIVRCQSSRAATSLRDVIAFGDYTNHAVMTYAEFSSALAWLVGQRLVSEVGGRLRARAQLVLEMQRFLTREIPNYPAERQWLETYLAKLPAIGQPPPITTTCADFDKAVYEYLHGEKN